MNGAAMIRIRAVASKKIDILLHGMTWLIIYL